MIQIGLIQINSSFSGQTYFPYSVGLLQSYVQTHSASPERYKFCLPIYKRTSVQDAVTSLKNSNVVGFSTYVWNARISLEIARALKEQNPGVVIIFGGPQVPDQPENFLRKNPFIDVVVHNEGEARFLEILERYPTQTWDDIAGIGFIARDGSFVGSLPGPRFKDLNKVPSPYLQGVFDELISRNPAENWIGIWETNRGCPFSCTFCDWGSAIAAKVTKFSLDRLYEEIDWFSKNKIEFVYCCDANFGMLKRDRDIANYFSNTKSRTGYPEALSIQGTKNTMEHGYVTLKLLSDAGLSKGVTLSMQSLDAEVLKSIKRDNISLDKYLDLQKRFSRDKVETYTDIILGLPGESYDSFLDGVTRLMDNGLYDHIQWNNLSILPNAELAEQEYRDKYGLVTIESKLSHAHAKYIQDEDGCAEVQELVIGTNSMPLDSWRRARVFCWTVSLLYFDKLIQIPLVVAHKLSNIKYRVLIESFLNCDSKKYPLLSNIHNFFEEEATKIQQGEPEYVYSKEWLGIFWPADEYILIQLTVEQQLKQFYDECGKLLKEILGETHFDIALLDDALRLNRSLLKQPFIYRNSVEKINYDLVDFCERVRNGEEPQTVIQPVTVEINRTSQVYHDLNQWCREVVWWENKKGAYLYNEIRVTS